MNRQEQIHRLLSRLRAGEPAGELDEFGLLRPQGVAARTRLNEVVTASAERGPQAERLAIWLLGPFGGAKSNTLLLMAAGLRGLGRGKFLSAVTRVDLKQGREASTPQGLQAALFYNLAFIGAGRLGDKVTAWVAPLQERAQRRGDAGANVLGLGVDVAIGLAGLTLPGVTGLAGKVVTWGSRKLALRKGKLRQRIRALGLNDPEAEEFMLSWVAYSLGPSDGTWAQFRRMTETLAASGRLFPVACRMLEKVGYSSVTLFLDECDLLIGNQPLTGALESIRAAGTEGRHELDLFFVMAGVDRISELANVQDYRGFVRRFISAEDGPVLQEQLSQPVLDGSAGDDLSRVIGVLGGLSPDAPAHLQQSLRISQEAATRIRTRLQHVKEPTWSKFWTAVFAEIDSSPPGPT